MKKLLIALLTVSTSLSLKALPLGNPWEASLHTDGIFCQGECPKYQDPCSSWCDAWSIRLGFYGDFVFNRRMRIDDNDNEANIRRTKIFTEAGYLALNFWERFDVFTTLGATNVAFFSPAKSFAPALPISLGNIGADLHTDTHFSWSLGARATLWECGCFGMGAEAQYFQTNPRINYTHLDGIAPVYPPQGEVLKYQEWQIGLGSSYRINIINEVTALVPYAGIRWARARINPGNLLAIFTPQFVNLHFPDLKSQREWGYSIGVTLLGCDKISATAEARFLDETAFYINAQFRF